MTTARNVHDYLDRIPQLNGARALKEMGGGPASQTWLVEYERQKWVLRIDSPHAATIGLDRKAELDVIKMVSKADIGPKLVWADPDQGILITEFIEGPTCSKNEIRDPHHLSKLARLLRHLHALPSAGSTFQAGLAATGYAQEIGTRASSELAEKVLGLESDLMADDPTFSLCHNDLNHLNIINTQSLKLIDWEYAAMGHALFDLAVVIAHHKLDQKTADGFLHEYLGRSDASAREKVAGFCQLYEALSSLWYELLGKQNAQS